MSDRAILKEKNSNNKNGEAHHHHGRSSQSKKEEKDTKAKESNESDTFLKRYKIMEKIGEGSYSEVLKCQNKLDGTLVACKRLKHIYKSWSDVSNIAEIATLRTIQKHVNILQMIEIHYDEVLGKVSLVFELMDVNLYELIKDRKRLLPESRVRTIMFQLFRALRHLHKLGIFHRDIKPENILIKTKTDQLKLGDLGSVRGMFSRPPYTEYISTRWYRSPECLLTAGHYSHKMDIWAAGCVFYEVLTLRPLFPGSSEIDQINRINNILGSPPAKLLETFQKQAEMERDTYRGQSQLNRRQQIQKVLDDYTSKCMLLNDSKNSSNKSFKSGSRHNVDYHFNGKEGTGLEKILPAHISREAKDIIKMCLAYDPEARPVANRIIQLSYFYELRESCSKNPEKISSKPVLTICGETVTEQFGAIDLGTLGDNKMKYRRGHHTQRPTKQSSTSYSQSKPNSKLSLEKKSSSTKDSNNNYIKNSSSPNENSLVSQSRSRISNTESKSLSKGSKGLSSQVFTVQKVRKGSLVDQNNNRIPRESRMSLNTQLEGEGTTTKIPVSKSRSRNYQSKNRHKNDQASTSSSFESGHSTEKKYRYKFNPSLQQQGQKVVDSKSSSLHASQKDSVKSSAGLNISQEVQISPYVQAPSELKFLQKKIKGDQHLQGKKPGSLIHTSSSQNNGQPLRGPVVPPKVAAAALKFAKVHASKQPNPSVLARNIQSHSRQTHVMEGSNNDTDGVSGHHTPADENTVKIGKLRFRQKQSTERKNLNSSMEDVLKPQHSAQVPTQQRSKIPVFVDDPTGSHLHIARGQSKHGLYRPSKLTSPPLQPSHHRMDTTEKWRTTESGIPRIVMSPERERNIRLLRESLTIDKNKRLKLRRLEQDLQNNNMEENSSMNYTTTEGVITPNRSSNFNNYTSNDTLPLVQGQQPQRIGGATFSSNRYRNSTTDYENPDVQDTSSASAAAPENRSIFKMVGSARPRITVNSDDLMKKPSNLKKSGSSYPPEILDIYTSRYRGPDVNMNILKDSSSYVKHPDRTRDAREKINQKLEMRRQQVNSSSVGDRPSKLISERGSNFINDYGSYTSSVQNTPGAQETEQHSKGGRFERRPPIPPGKMLGLRHAETGKALSSYREISEENVERGRRDDRKSYHSTGSRRASMIPTMTQGTEEKPSALKTSRRSVSNVGHSEKIRTELKDHKRRVERMRSTMRDDVFCSSDDDVVTSMRKKFDKLINERAQRLSDSLKSNPGIPGAEQDDRNYYDSDDDITPPPIRLNTRNKAGSSNEKSRKHARRALRARMAESLTMNNIASNHWRLANKNSNLRTGQQVIIDNPSHNSSGDYVVAGTSYSNDKADAGSKRSPNSTKYIPPNGGRSTIFPNIQHQATFVRSRRDPSDVNNEYRERYKQPQNNHNHQTISSRIYPFSRHEQNSRHGQIYTPPGNKPQYQHQAPEVGAMLHDRKLRYSHNLPVPISNSQSNYSQRDLEETAAYLVNHVK